MASICAPISSTRSTRSSFTTEQKLIIFGYKTNEVLLLKKNCSCSLRLRASSSDITPKMIIRQLADRHRRGTAIEGGGGFRQVFVVRQCDVGADKNVTIECIFNLLQDITINHMMSGINGDESGVSPGMLKHNLVWNVANLTVEVDNYPGWDDVLEVDTWITPSGKLGVQNHWTIRNLVTGEFQARARRRFSNIPSEVMDEVSQIFSEKKDVEEKCTTEKIEKLVDAKYTMRNLKPERSDRGTNKYVKNVKYANWMLEAIPEEILKDYQLSTITLEYKKGCRISETIQSLCEPDKDDERHGEDGSIYNSSNGFTHLLQVEGDEKNEEIVRGRTTWKSRNV
ncbi:hypothetical protein ACFE04_009192 [Oxalis oulophora]